VKIAKWITLGKIRFAGLVKDSSQLQVFSLLPISSRIEWGHKSTAWLPSTVQNGGLHFVRIAGISEAKTSASEKAECLLV